MYFPSPEHALRAANAIEGVLPGSVKAELSAGQTAHDLTAAIGRQIFHVDWLRRGDLRSVLERLQSSEPPTLLVAPQLTEAARQAARKAGVAWIDETGAAEVVADDIIIRL